MTGHALIILMYTCDPKKASIFRIKALYLLGRVICYIKDLYNYIVRHWHYSFQIWVMIFNFFLTKRYEIDSKLIFIYGAVILFPYFNHNYIVTPIPWIRSKCNYIHERNTCLTDTLIDDRQDTQIDDRQDTQLDKQVLHDSQRCVQALIE